MNWSYKFLIVIIIIGVGCQSQPSLPKPSPLISEPQMVEIMTDVQLAEATAGIKVGIKPELRQKQKQIYIQAILKKYQISPQSYWENYHYYAAQPEVLDTLYAQVLQKLEKILPQEQERMRKNPPSPAQTPPQEAPVAPKNAPVIGKKGLFQQQAPPNSTGQK